MKPKQLTKTSLITIRILTTFMIVSFSGCVHVDGPSLELWNTMSVSASKYFPHSLGSSWVYEDQDGKELIRRAIEGKEIKGTLYKAFSCEPGLADHTVYSPLFSPALYNDTDATKTLLADDAIAKSIKARLRKEMEAFASYFRYEHMKDAGIEITVQIPDHLLLLPAIELIDHTEWQVSQIKATMKIDLPEIDKDGTITFEFTISEKGRVIGAETINTTAGTFKDCLKVKYWTETKVVITPTPDPADVVIEPPGETITTVWFAPNIGMAKYQQIAFPIFLDMIPANDIQPDIPKLSPYSKRTLQLKKVDIK